MPTWANLQSLIQLGVAINAAIFSVKALREPLVAREREAMDALTRQHDSMRADPDVRGKAKWPEFHSHYLKVRAAFVECGASIERWDRWIQKIAGGAAVASIIALVVSAYRSDEDLGPGGVAVLVGMTVLPSLLAIVFNANFVSRKLDSVRRLRTEADSYLVDLIK